MKRMLIGLLGVGSIVVLGLLSVIPVYLGMVAVASPALYCTVVGGCILALCANVTRSMLYDERPKP